MDRSAGKYLWLHVFFSGAEYKLFMWKDTLLQEWIQCWWNRWSICMVFAKVYRMHFHTMFQNLQGLHLFAEISSIRTLISRRKRADSSRTPVNSFSGNPLAWVPCWLPIKFACRRSNDRKGGTLKWGFFSSGRFYLPALLGSSSLPESFFFLFFLFFCLW